MPGRCGPRTAGTQRKHKHGGTFAGRHSWQVETRSSWNATPLGSVACDVRQSRHGAGKPWWRRPGITLISVVVRTIERGKVLPARVGNVRTARHLRRECREARVPTRVARARYGRRVGWAGPPATGAARRWVGAPSRRGGRWLFDCCRLSVLRPVATRNSGATVKIHYLAKQLQAVSWRRIANLGIHRPSGSSGRLILAIGPGVNERAATKGGKAVP